MILRRLSLLLVGGLWGLTLLVEAGGALGLIVLPPLAFLGGRHGIEHSPMAWFLSLGIPGSIAVLLGGVILHSPDSGASLWRMSLLFVLLTSGLAAAGCALGSRRDEPRSGEDE